MGNLNCTLMYESTMLNAVDLDIKAWEGVNNVSTEWPIYMRALSNEIVKGKTKKSPLKNNKLNFMETLRVKIKVQFNLN